MPRTNKRGPLTKLVPSNAPASTAAAVVLFQRHSKVTLCDLSCVGVHSIDHHLYARGFTTPQSAREIGWNDDECIQLQAIERIFRLLHAPVLMRHVEVHVPCRRVDEAPAFGCDTFIHDAETQIANLRVQGESENDQHDRWRKHQLNQENPVAPQLLNFFGSQREITSNRCRHDSLL